MMRKPDIRTIKTKSNIKKQFLILLKNKSLHEIRISELTSLCKINRNTFYLHYKSLDDLFFSLKNEIFAYFLNPTKTFDIEELAYNIDILIELYSNILNEKNNARNLLFNTSLSDKIINELSNCIVDEIFDRYKKTIYTIDLKYKINLHYIVYGYFYAFKMYSNTSSYNIEFFKERISLILNKGVYNTYKHTLHR